jgi:hypothetical protein
MKKKIKLILFHGLYSKGDNLTDLAGRLKSVAVEEGHEVIVVEHDYPKLNASMGYFDWSRDIVRDYMLKCLQLEYALDKNIYNIVLTHSNATWGISRVVGKYFCTGKRINEIKIDRLVLFGSTIKRNYDWGRYPIKRVINFVGTRDRVVWLSKLFKMGWSGRKGFKIKAPNLTQVYKSWRHSDFVLEKNFEVIRQEVFKEI